MSDAIRDVTAGWRLREDVAATARLLKTRGLTAGKSGNVSARHGRGFLITPSGVDYEGMSGQDIVWVTGEGTADGSGLAPSSEWRLHAAIYAARPEAEAIVHAHPRYSTALSTTRRAIPPFHYMVAAAGGRDIRCAAYATFGSDQLARNAVAALRDRKACLLANHGSLALGPCLRCALDLVEEVEWLAAEYCEALAIGEIALIPDYEMERVLERFKSYGQPERK
jgi:L-fuculose-phosphate aldolase